MPRQYTSVLHDGVRLLFTSCGCASLSQPLASATALKAVVQERPAVKLVQHITDHHAAATPDACTTISAGDGVNKPTTAN